MLRNLIDLLKGTRDWAGHSSWLVLALAMMGAAILMTPEDSIYAASVDPVRLLWKLTMVLSAAWLAYQLARLVLPYDLRLDMLLSILGTSGDHDREARITALICAVVIGRLLFMGLVALAVSGGV